MLKAGLDGIKNKITPPPYTDANIYELTEEERAELGIENLPENIMEAMKELEKDTVIREALGEHIFNRYMDAKKIEWFEYCTQVTPWELKAYLNKF
jgi:glutamine synthetase